MTRRLWLAAISILLATPCALALNNRSAVSVNGSDMNDCSTPFPCRSFTAAIAATVPGGEVVAFDSAGYGPFTVSTSLTISGAPGVHAAITASSGNAISITAGLGDKVILRNLVLIGTGGATGISFTGGLATTVIGCLIRGFSAYGVHADAVDGRIVLDHCAVMDNAGGDGIYVDGGTNPGALTVSNTSIEGNAVGIHADYHTRVAVVNTTISGNTTGVEAVCTLPNFYDTTVIVESSTIANNGTGVFANASGAQNDTANILLAQVVMAQNQLAASTTDAGVITSFHNNRFVGNASNGVPMATATFK